MELNLQHLKFRPIPIGFKTSFWQKLFCLQPNLTPHLSLPQVYATQTSSVTAVRSTASWECAGSVRCALTTTCVRSATWTTSMTSAMPSSATRLHIRNREYRTTSAVMGVLGNIRKQTLTQQSWIHLDWSVILGIFSGLFTLFPHIYLRSNLSMDAMRWSLFSSALIQSSASVHQASNPWGTVLMSTGWTVPILTTWGTLRKMGHIICLYYTSQENFFCRVCAH